MHIGNLAFKIFPFFYNQGGDDQKYKFSLILNMPIIFFFAPIIFRLASKFLGKNVFR
jgi:hypothetical protein